MPISKKDLYEEMGMAYVPFTFPTVGVAELMSKGDGISTTYAEVDMLWNAYYNAQMTGNYKPFNLNGGGQAAYQSLVDEMQRQTGSSPDNIAAWLVGLAVHAQTHPEDSYYLNPKASVDSSAQGNVDWTHPLDALKSVTKSVGEAAANLAKPTLDPVTNLVKYAAIAVVGVAVIYGVYQGVSIYKAGKRRRKSK